MTATELVAVVLLTAILFGGIILLVMRALRVILADNAQLRRDNERLNAYLAAAAFATDEKVRNAMAYRIGMEAAKPVHSDELYRHLAEYGKREPGADGPNGTKRSGLSMKSNVAGGTSHVSARPTKS